MARVRVIFRVRIGAKAGASVSVRSTNVGNLISGSSAFSKTSLNIQKFTVQVLLKPGLENFEHYFASVKKSEIVW